MRFIRGTLAVLAFLIGSATFAQADVSPDGWVQKTETITVGTAGATTGPTATSTTPTFGIPTATSPTSVAVTPTATPEDVTYCAVDVGINDGTAGQISTEAGVNCSKPSTVTSGKMVIQEYLHQDLAWINIETRNFDSRATPAGYGPVEVPCTSDAGIRVTFTANITTPDGSATYPEQEDSSCR